MECRLDNFHIKLLTTSNQDLALVVNRNQAMALQIRKQLLDHLHFRGGLGQLVIVTLQGSLILLLASLILGDLSLQLGDLRLVSGGCGRP